MRKPTTILILAIALSMVLARPAFAAAAADQAAKIRALQAHIDELDAQKAKLDEQAHAATADGVEPSAEIQKANAAEIDAARKLPPDEYSRGKVLDISNAEKDVSGVKTHTQTFRVTLTDGKEKGSEVTIEESDLDLTTKNRPVAIGDVVVIVKSYQLDGTASYYVADNYRIPPLVYVALIFFLAAIVFGGKRGLTSILGLASTVAVIIWYVVPRIVGGGNPLTVCLVAALFIATLSLYLAHGFNTRTTIALVSTLVTLGISAWMAVRCVAWARLFGMGSEDALFLQGSGFDNLDLRGLLLGGIILGVLGILDDITTAQAAIVDELKHANPKLEFRELYRRGLSVGREHIASLINTLFLAYAGASLPLFLLFSANKGQPLWFVVNSEIISEEIVRTLVGSLCLILAVPITTAFAASFYGERRVGAEGFPREMHHHH